MRDGGLRMARLTNEARRQVNALARHYRRIDRVEAVQKLLQSVELALQNADRIAARGSQFPRPYRQLAKSGVFWIKAHRYWFAYEMDVGEAVITQMFFDQANIPARVKSGRLND
jgi:hypothetical protein